MLTSNSFKRWSWVAAAFLVVTAMWNVVGCQSDQANRTSLIGPTTQPIHASIATSSKSGSQLWGETCTRCHNVRPPQYYSDAQWDIIVHHMRLRANLTGEEQREITKFLQASN